LAIMFHVVLCWFCWSVMDWETPREADWDWSEWQAWWLWFKMVVVRSSWGSTNRDLGLHWFHPFSTFWFIFLFQIFSYTYKDVNNSQVLFLWDFDIYYFCFIQFQIFCDFLYNLWLIWGLHV
jgi:hypothetical protein